MTTILRRDSTASGTIANTRSQVETSTNFGNVVNGLRSEHRAGDASGGLLDQVATVKKTILDAVGYPDRDTKPEKLVADIQAVIAKSPDLRTKANELFGRFKSGLDFEAYLERTGGNVDEAKRLYALDASFLNFALGSNGKPLVENLSIHIAGLEIETLNDIVDFTTGIDKEEEIRKRQKLINDVQAA